MMVKEEELIRWELGLFLSLFSNEKLEGVSDKVYRLVIGRLVELMITLRVNEVGKDQALKEVSAEERLDEDQKVYISERVEASKPYEMSSVAKKAMRDASMTMEQMYEDLERP